MIRFIYFGALIFVSVLEGAFSTSVRAQTIFTVTTTIDSGPGSLHQAILNANDSPNEAGRDSIRFNIPGAGPHTITFFSALPEVTDPVVIDGLSQPGATCAAWPPTLQIELKSALPDQSGLRVTSGHTTIRGLVLGEFAGPAYGIGLFDRPGNNVECCFIGTDVTGLRANGYGTGIYIVSADSTIIGGEQVGSRNLISGNEWGIVIASSQRTVIQGNFIGTDVTGLSSLGNGSDGIFFENDATRTLIGGESEAAQNVISGNERAGIYVQESSDNRIVGNYIGTDRSGMAPLGNGIAGIYLSDAPDNRVGGLEEGAGNAIAFNRQNGIRVYSESKKEYGVTIEGNRIFGNGRLGIDIGEEGVATAATSWSPLFPDLKSAYADVSTITGTFTGSVSQWYHLAFYSSTECDSSGYGEGEEYLGTFDLEVTGGIPTPYTLTLQGIPLTAGRFVTATATDADGRTSEFSACVAVKVTGVGTEEVIPYTFRLEPNYPNPFNPETTISFEIGEEGPVEIVAYDVNGRLVDRLVSRRYVPGRYRLSWKPSLPSGTYYLRLQTGRYSTTRTVTLVK